MISPERELINRMEQFLIERLEGTGAGRVVYEEVLDELGELKLDISREYNQVIA